MTTTTEHTYVVTNDKILGGEPVIKGTRTPVRAVVEMYQSGLSAEEIPNHLPHLTLSQIFDALSFYNDHQEMIHDYILQNRIPAEKINSKVRDE